MGKLVVGITGMRLSQEEKNVLTHPLIEGVILFSRNYENLFQLKNLTHHIHHLRSPALKIYVDQEGGRVQRFQEGFTPLPSPGDLTLENAEHYGEIMASELKALGIDFSFAPVVDLNKGSVVIGKRAFASTPGAVIQMAEPYIQGMQKSCMPAIIKHFPGHGTAILDTHFELAEDQRSFAEIEREDLIPFTHFIKQNVFGIMASHVLYPAVDSMPVTLSYHWIQNVLRDQLKFQGKIYSDDLGMKALAHFGSPFDLVKATFEAGSDYALLCNEWPAVIQTLDGLS